MKINLLAAAIGIGLAGCAANGDGSPSSGSAQAVQTISPRVWEDYQRYVRMHSGGAYAVSADGSRSGYSFCPETRCVNEVVEARRLALSACGPGCRIFAYGSDIRARYEIRP